MKRHQTETGFSLVELAIALTVIGLILAGLLKATEVIENGRINTMVSQFGHYDASVLAFRSLYGALPGDIRDPARLSGCANFCATVGNGDGRIFIQNNANFAAMAGESHRVWLHMARAGLTIPVDYGYNGGTSGPGIDYPETAFSGYMYHMHFNTQGLSASNPLPEIGHYLTTLGKAVTYKQAQKIDIKMDDGLPVSGKVAAWSRNAANAVVPCGPFASNKYETADMGLMCDVAVKMNF